MYVYIYKICFTLAEVGRMDYECDMGKNYREANQLIDYCNSPEKDDKVLTYRNNRGCGKETL